MDENKNRIMLKPIEEIQKIDFNSDENRKSFERIEKENEELLKDAKQVSGYQLIEYLNNMGFIMC